MLSNSINYHKSKTFHLRVPLQANLQKGELRKTIIGDNDRCVSLCSRLSYDKHVVRLCCGIMLPIGSMLQALVKS